MKFNEYQQCVSNTRRVKLAFIYIRNVRCFHSKEIWGRGKRQWNYSGRNIHTSKQRHLCEWFKEKSKDITCFWYTRFWWNSSFRDYKLQHDNDAPIFVPQFFQFYQSLHVDIIIYKVSIYYDYNHMPLFINILEYHWIIDIME